MLSWSTCGVALIEDCRLRAPSAPHSFPSYSSPVSLSSFCLPFFFAGTFTYFSFVFSITLSCFTLSSDGRFAAVPLRCKVGRLPGSVSCVQPPPLYYFLGRLLQLLEFCWPCSNPVGLSKSGPLRTSFLAAPVHSLRRSVHSPPASRGFFRTPEITSPSAQWFVLAWSL